MATVLSTLTGRQKAAILLISLGPELSGQIFRHLTDEEIEQLTLEIASLRRVDSDTRAEVLDEFHEMVMAQEYIAQGGIEYAKELLEKGLGPQKAAEIIHRLTASLHVRPFDFARKTDPAQLLNFIQHEHPQTIALILAYLNPEQAGQILSSLPAELQVEVAKRLATLDRTSPEVLEEVEATLERRLSAFVTQDFTVAGGIDVAVDILNRVDRATEKTIMDALEEEDPELAEEIKKRMFVFEDIVLLSDRDIQMIVREVDSSEWALALKTASEEVQERIFKNMSKRAAEMLKEEMEYLGPVRLRDVEEAQQKIVSIIRRLEEAGEIVVVRGGEDELVV
ncbi:MAG: flagellar motor switch protein FliG [Clostridia bacterium]|nr:flagellar motor switch protein FliG [Bacillota bacterium]MBO2520317.1 flagellar motor switch protein FliG [Bacillota bacterium]